VKIDDDWFPIIALALGFLLGCGAIFVASDKGQTEAIAMATNLITMAGTAYGLRAKYSREEND